MNMRRHRRPKHRGSHRRAPLTSRGPDLLAATWTLRLVLSAIRRPGDERVLVEEAAQLSGVRNVWERSGMAGLTSQAAALAGVRDLGSPKAGPLAPQLVARLRILEATKVDRSKGLLRNADTLARELRLTRIERDLMVLSVMTTLHPSFLQERGRAKQSWEVTQVNELLVQMETFPGIVVCATNLVDSLDQASLRRFAVKVEFLPLRPEQRWAMFQRLAGEATPEPSRAAVNRLHGLTAGDFAAVARQWRLVVSESSTEALVAMLERELVLRKGSGGRRIGFG
jgi:SpoVK/Ycf46/Vps4 family AAA+-type ATPase